jgi:magnesium transporter
MLRALPEAATPAAPSGAAAPDALAGKVWIDMIEPTDAERASFEAAFALRVPSKAALGEIEATSRLQAVDGALYMTAPLIFAGENEPWFPTPTGFVLSQRVLMTVRFAQSAAFDAAAKQCGAAPKLEPAIVFVNLLEALVDHLADLLEAASRHLDDASHSIFRPDRKRLSHETAMLRQLMIRTGRTSERMARIHYTLVCLDRMAKFAAERARDWLPHDVPPRLQAVSSDVASLVQFSEGLVSRVQLLQDAAAGIINIDQNDVMKVLTIASVVGIPPVLVAGIYGMNFKNIHEYDWAWGYQWGLALIAISALLPLIWFKWKDWI